MQLWAVRPQPGAAPRGRRGSRRGVAHAGRWSPPLLISPPDTAVLSPGATRWTSASWSCTYIMLGWGLNIVVGLAGLLDLGYVAFYAVGAYTYALMSTDLRPRLLDLPAARRAVRRRWPACCSVSPCCGCAATISPSSPWRSARSSASSCINWTHLTGGPNGITDIPRPTLFGLKFNSGSGDPDTFAAFFGLEASPTQRVIFLYYVILALALLTNWVTLRLRRLPLGRAWEALREDEIACRALGINVTVTKLTAFAIGAMFGGFAGAFFATRQGFISPESFTFIESPRSCWPSWCWAGSAASSAWPWPPS